MSSEYRAVDVFRLSSVLSIVSCVARSLWRIVVAEVSVWRIVELPEVIRRFRTGAFSIFVGVPIGTSCQVISVRYTPKHPCLQSGRQCYIVTPVWR